MVSQPGLRVATVDCQIWKVERDKKGIETDAKDPTTKTE